MVINNKLIIQWLTYTALVESKPTLNFTLALQTIFFVSNRYINATGSLDVNISDLTNTSITIFSSGANVPRANIPKGQSLHTLIVGY